MDRNEFLKLFELEDIYNQYKEEEDFGLGLFDHLTGSKNMIIYYFNKNKLKLVMESDEFNNEIQELELHLILNDNKIEINKNEIFKNETFPFLTFETNLDADLKFIANFINKILKPKCHLIRNIFTN
jgi:hypothetical protein